MRKATKIEQNFSMRLLEWHLNANNRPMPWKGEKDPYKIWLSEIILQQTRVAQGLPYYLKFVKTYRTLQQLAEADDTAVFKLWEGLGYYSRCRNLLAGARQIMDLHGGVFPNNHADILSIKGVGPYTAAAIASFGFDLPFAVVDGNVTRLLSRYFGIDTPFDSSEGKKLFAEQAQKLLVPGKAALYNQAIMDFGASVCTPAEPLCGECVFREHCFAFKKGRIKDLPVRSKKPSKKNRWFTYFIIRANDSILVKQRHAKDIWQSLHEFYLVENTGQREWTKDEIANELNLQKKANFTVTRQSAVYKQQLTHQTIYARFFELKAASQVVAPAGFKWISEEKLSELAFPRIINSYLNTISSSPILLF